LTGTEGKDIVDSETEANQEIPSKDEMVVARQGAFSGEESRNQIVDASRKLTSSVGHTTRRMIYLVEGDKIKGSRSHKGDRCKHLI
jgi:hypothetical protein